MLANGISDLPLAKLKTSAVGDAVSSLPNVPSFGAATVPPTYKASALSTAGTANGVSSKHKDKMRFVEHLSDG